MANTPKNPPAPAPAAVPVPSQAWQPTDAQVVAAQDRENIRRQLVADDAARAAAGTTTLVAIAGFTRVTDEFPNGETILPGQEFVISDFDAQKYAGKGVPRA